MGKHTTDLGGKTIAELLDKDDDDDDSDED